MEPIEVLTVEPVRYTAHYVRIHTDGSKNYLSKNPPPPFTPQESTLYAWLLSIDGTVVAGCRIDGQPLLTEKGLVFFRGHPEVPPVDDGPSNGLRSLRIGVDRHLTAPVGDEDPQNRDQIETVRSLIADPQCRCMSFQTALLYPEESEFVIRLRLPHPVYDAWRKRDEQAHPSEEVTLDGKT